MVKKQKIIAIGDTDAPYHPLENIASLDVLLCDHQVIFTDDYAYFLKLSDFSLCICYVDAFANAGKPPLSCQQAAALKEYLKQGGNMLSFHNGISLQDTPGLSDVMGARFTHHPPYDELQIRIKTGHPVTDGVQDFTISDEPYHFEVPGVLDLLASYEYHGRLLPAAWERKVGGGTLIYLMPGHDHTAFQCESYRRLIQNSVNYLQPIGTSL